MKAEMILKELVSININGQMAVNMKKSILILLACLIVFMTACAGQGKDVTQSEAAEYLRKWDQIDSVKWSKELISN